MSARVNTLSQETPDHLVAESLVFSAGRLAERMRSEGVSSRSKANIADVVTEADVAAEALVVSELRRVRPEDSILGEEGAADTGTSGRRWIIDPVDGTYNFLSGAGPWCSAIALQAEDGRLLTSAVYVPQTDELFSVSDDADRRVAQGPLDAMSLATYLHPSWMQHDPVRTAWHAVASRAATVRMFGSGSVDLSFVSAGRIGAWMQHSVPAWDWLPGKALVESAGGLTAEVEAGGVVWSLAGGEQAVTEMTRLLRGAR
jgi:fructose-1,6-bisphosphatase/inositol monophosphatase family enzyme